MVTFRCLYYNIKIENIKGGVGMKKLIKRTSLILVAFVISMFLLATQNTQVDLRAGEEDIPGLFIQSVGYPI